MGLAHEKKSYLQEKANLFEIGSFKKPVSAIGVVELIIQNIVPESPVFFKGKLIYTTLSIDWISK